MTPGELIRQWAALNYPEETMPRADWLELFRAMPYAVDGEPRLRPAEPVELYRGADEWRCHGLSWTRNRATALRFATNDGRRSAAGRLFVATVDPARFLAEWTQRHEFEVIVDTEGLRVRDWTFAEVEAAPAPQRRPWSATSLLGWPT